MDSLEFVKILKRANLHVEPCLIHILANTMISKLLSMVELLLTSVKTLLDLNKRLKHRLISI